MDCSIVESDHLRKSGASRDGLPAPKAATFAAPFLRVTAGGPVQVRPDPSGKRAWNAK